MMDRKLSTMIMMGSTLLERFDPLTYLECDEEGKWYGCAIGMACKAVGVPSAKKYEMWPWLYELSRNGFRYVSYVSCMFRTVCGLDPMGNSDAPIAHTIEEIVDWVKLVEPECGECNRFQCSCVQRISVEEAEEVCYV